MTDRETISAQISTDSSLWADFDQYAARFDNKSAAVRSAIREGIVEDEQQTRTELIRDGLPAGIVLSFVLAVLTGVLAIATAITAAPAAATTPALISVSGAVLSIALVELAKRIDEQMNDTTETDE